MIFDECPPVHVDGAPVGVDVVERSMQLSLRWAERSKRAHEGNDAALFGIVQGGVHHDLRTRSAEGLKQIGFDGYAIGGLAVGETEAERNAMLDHTCPQLPEDRPRYLMGVGRPGGPGGSGRARRRHVRLRDADPQRAQRPLLHQHRHGAHPQREIRARHCARSRKAAAATPAATATAAPTCATWTAATRCWRRSWAPCTTSGTTSR